MLSLLSEMVLQFVTFAGLDCSIRIDLEEDLLVFTSPK
jgi:hypothetical protein